MILPRWLLPARLHFLGVPVLRPCVPALLCPCPGDGWPARGLQARGPRPLSGRARTALCLSHGAPTPPPAFPLYPSTHSAAPQGACRRLWVRMGWRYSKGQAGGPGGGGGEWRGAGRRGWGVKQGCGLLRAGAIQWGGGRSLWVPQYLLWLGCAVGSWALGLLDCTKSCSRQ